MSLDRQEQQVLPDSQEQPGFPASAGTLDLQGSPDQADFPELAEMRDHQVSPVRQDYPVLQD